MHRRQEAGAEVVSSSSEHLGRPPKSKSGLAKGF
jgi:hypothetical protein